MANIFSDFWYRINKKLVPRNSKVTETSSDFIVELQNANNDKPADRETLVSFSIPKGTSFTPQDRQQVNAALETFKNVSSISSDQWTALKDASKFENRLTTVEEDIDSLEIGGRNLYTGTRDFSGGDWKNINKWVEESEKYGTFFVRSKSTKYAGVWQPVSVKKGEQYVLGGYFKAEAGSSVSMMISDANDNTITDKRDVIIGGSNEDLTNWRRFSLTFNITSDGVLAARVVNNTDGKKLCVCGLKLERGNKATDWTPAPEDKADVSALAKKADVSTLAEKADVSVILPSASVESSTTASQAYSVDSLIMVNGALRRVTSVIKKGDTISDSNSTVTTVSSELSRLSHQSTISEYSNVPHGGLRLNINNNRTHQLYGTAIVRNDEWDSIWSNSVKCPGISDNNWYIKTNFKVWTPSKAYNVPCAGIFIGGISQYILPENFNNAIYYVGSDGYIYLQIGSSKPTTTYLWFFWGRVAEEGIA